MTFSRMHVIGLATAVLLAAAQPPARAAQQALYERTDVSIGALAHSSAFVLEGRALRTRAFGAEYVTQIRVIREIKGACAAEIPVRHEAASSFPAGEILVFLTFDEKGLFRLQGGDHFGIVDLAKEPADLVRAHLDSALRRTTPADRARALAASLRSPSHRLRGDAVIDLYRDPEAAASLGEGTRDDLCAALSDPAQPRHLPGELPALLVTVGRFQTSQAFEALYAALEDGAVLRHAHALIRAFQELGDPFRPELVRRFEKDAAPGRIAATITVLAGLRERSAVPGLLVHAGGDDPALRRFAILGLGDIGDGPCVDTLVQIVKDETRSFDDRAFATVALGFSGDSRAGRLVAECEAAVADPKVKDLIGRFRREPAKTRWHLLHRK